MDFDDASWLRMIYLISETQAWLNQLETYSFHRLPFTGRHRLTQQGFRLSATVLARVADRCTHAKQPPKPGWFSVPVMELLPLLIRLNSARPERLDPRGKGNERSRADDDPRTDGNALFTRTLDTAGIIGMDRRGLATSMLTVIQDSSGRILAVLPGMAPHSNK